MSAFDRFIGIDFSGSGDAGRSIWLATAALGGSGIVVDRLLPACDLPDGGVPRHLALAALGRFIAGQQGALIGLDFPFGLPAALVEAPDWLSFALGFSGRYADAERFREDCRARSGGRELRRRTDIEARTPFCAYNLRLYRQTWWGIAGLLAPLLDRGSVSVPPMMPVLDGRPALVEICPASTLKRLGCYGGYKGRSVAALAARRSIMACLEANGVEVPAGLARITLVNHGGDALDAVVAAFTCWRISQKPGELSPRDGIDLIEARVLL